MPRPRFHLRTVVIAVACSALLCDFANRWWRERRFERRIARLPLCVFGKVVNGDGSRSS